MPIDSLTFCQSTRDCFSTPHGITKPNGLLSFLPHRSTRGTARIGVCDLPTRTRPLPCFSNGSDRIASGTAEPGRRAVVPDGTLYQYCLPITGAAKSVVLQVGAFP